MSSSKALAGLRTVFAVVWFQFCLFCGFLNFHFNWKTMRFQVLKKRKRVSKFIFLNIAIVLTFFVLIGTKNVFKSIFVYTVVVPYPVNLFCKQLFFEQRRTIRHLNRLLRCVQDAQRLTEKQVIFTLPLCVTLVSMLLSGLMFTNFIVRWVIAAGVRAAQATILSMLMLIILQPFIRIYMHSHFVCCEVFCLRAVMVDLNDYLSDWIEDFNFYRQLKMIRKVQPKLRELSQIYKRLSRSLLSFNSILGHDMIGLVFMMSLAFVYILNSRVDNDVSPVFALLMLYFSCLWDVIFGCMYYRRIYAELTRTRTLIETVKVRPDQQIDRDMNCMLVAVDIVKLGLDVYTKRTEKVVGCVIGFIFLKLAYNFGRRQHKH